MAGFQGMDPVVIRGDARQMRQQAQQLDDVIAAVQQAVQQAYLLWDGEDATGFSTMWTAQHRPAIVAAHAVLVDMAATVERNADEQEAASGAGTGPGGAAGAALAGVVAGAAAGALAGAGRGTTLRVAPAAYLDMARAAYKKGDALPPGWKDVSSEQLRKAGLDPTKYTIRNGVIETRDGMNARILTDGKGKFVIAYAGSVTARDWGDNAGSAGSGHGVASRGMQVEDSVDLAKAVSASAGAENVSFTGHSLGGREAAAASIATGGRAVTFNAAGLTDEDIAYARAVSGRSENFWEFAQNKMAPGAQGASAADIARVTNYSSTYDPLTAAQRATPFISDAFGRTIPVDVPGHVDPRVNHGLDGFEGRV